MMGRHIGKRGAYTLLGLTGLSLGVGAYLLAITPTLGRDLDEPTDVSFAGILQTVDPSCLWPVLDVTIAPDAPEAPDAIPLHGCAPDGAKEVGDDGWVRVSLQSGEPGDLDFERRFSGARVAQVTGAGRVAIEAYDNWGGSGVFSSLVTGQLARGAAVLTGVAAHSFGDRCNGGLVGTRVDSEGRLFANASMTPWDIMVTPLSELPIESQWDAGKERFGEAFNVAPSCASCCSAVTREYSVSPMGEVLEIGLRFDASVATSSSETALVACLAEAVQTAGGDDGFVDMEETDALSDLVDACAALPIEGSAN